jgi:small-conductance mechanosensitive channel
MDQFRGLTEQLGLLNMYVALTFIAILFGYLLTTSALAVIQRKTTLDKENVKFIKWFFLLLLVHQFKIVFIDNSGISFLQNGFIILEFIILWMIIKNFINGFIADFYFKKTRKIPVNSITMDFFKFIFLGLLIFGFLKSIFDIDINSILTSSLVITAVIGLSMQDTIGSLISGLLIQIEKPFKVGDWICISDKEGKVVETNWRYTKIETIQKNFIVIPNNNISKEIFINYNDPTPVLSRTLILGVSYEVPPVRVKEAIMAVLTRSAHVLQHPRPKVRLADFADSNVIYNILFFIKQFDHNWPAIDEINSGIWYEFKKQGIEIAFPIRTVIMSKKQKEDVAIQFLTLLKTIELFEGMSDEDLHLLVRSSDVKKYAPDTTIISRGALDTTLFVILEGKVSVRQNNKEFAQLEAGTFFGEMALLTGEPRNADLVALEPTVCLVVDREGFKGLLEKRRRIIQNVHEIFRKRQLEMASGNVLSEAAKVEPKSLFSRFRKIFSLDASGGRKHPSTFTELR